MTREQAKDYLYDIASMFGTVATDNLTGKDGDDMIAAVDVLADQGDVLTIEGYTITRTDETIEIRKGKRLRAVFLGNIKDWVILRQLVFAIINADGEE